MGQDLWLLAGWAAVAFVLVSPIAWGSYWLTIFLQELFFGADAESVFSRRYSFHGHVLVVIAAIGLPVVLWRAHASQTQSAAASDQSNTAQSNLLNERYQKGVEMLGNQELSVRLGGIYALGRLAENEASTYHIQIMSVLSGYVRDWHTADGRAGMQSEDTSGAEKSDLPEDVGTVLEVIGRRSNKQREIEEEREYVIVLMEANLHRWMCDRPDRVSFQDFSCVRFDRANLSETFIKRATFACSNFLCSNLSSAVLTHADISGANFSGADLSEASLVGADVANALFEGAKLSGTDLSEVKGLTQEQLNSAHIDPQRPPILPDAVDPHTGKPLVVPDQKPTS